jgi:tRNA(Ile)-lysidine synthase TilS/MesJ
LREFAAAVPGFAQRGHPDRVLHFGWYIHAHNGKDRFDQAAIRACYKELRMDEPNLSEQFKRLIEKRPKVLLQDARGYYLEYSRHEALDKKYGQHETTIALSKLCKICRGKSRMKAEKPFLSEAIICYHNRAFVLPSSWCGISPTTIC